MKISIPVILLFLAGPLLLVESADFFESTGETGGKNKLKRLLKVKDKDQKSGEQMSKFDNENPFNLDVPSSDIYQARLEAGQTLTGKYMSMPTCPKYADFMCAKCGQILECYVDAMDGSPEYSAAKDYILYGDFCGGFKTECGGQQCAQKQGLEVYPASSADDSCPVIGGFQCKGGAAKGKPAGLSNFATYRLQLKGDCSAAGYPQCSYKCDSGTCSCGGYATSFCYDCVLPKKGKKKGNYLRV